MDKNTIIGLVIISLLLIGYMFISRPSKEEIAERERIQDSILHENMVKEEEAKVAAELLKAEAEKAAKAAAELAAAEAKKKAANEAAAKEEKVADKKEEQPKEATAAPEKPYFAIQLMNTATKLQEGDYRLKGFKGVRYVPAGERFKVIYSQATDYQVIKNELAEVRETFPEAFIVAFLGDKQITTAEALELLKK